MQIHERDKRQEEIERDVHEFMAQQYLAKLGIERIGVDEQIFEQGIVDSLGMLELLTFLEGKFGVSFGPDDLTWDNVSKIRKIAAAILALQEKTTA